MPVSVNNPTLINQRGLHGFIATTKRQLEGEDWKEGLQTVQSDQHQTLTDSLQPQSQSVCVGLSEQLLELLSKCLYGSATALQPLTVNVDNWDHLATV